ncbi:hypothetical protein Bhyg_01620 [Pseudolycoriella hygida]|uniref:Coilin N-terminal domain-containing protein n=1 Tax=Pseudolycoriella hygida TaxID=35572 RepID=A0A9Q0NA02_9DIPT|nr:hypothetical protein Bhyg_01620 [Pseudolycoriella hygida]
MTVRCTIRLNNIFNDHRKEALVGVKSNFKEIIDFEKHIQKLFNINFGIYLTIEGSLLPSQESVELIRPGDVVIVNKLDQRENGEEEAPSHGSVCELEDKTEIYYQFSGDTKPRGKRIRKRKKKQKTHDEIQELPQVKKSDVCFTKKADESLAKPISHIRFSNEATEKAAKRSDNAAVDASDASDVIARVMRPVIVCMYKDLYQLQSSVLKSLPFSVTDAGTSVPPDNAEGAKLVDVSNRDNMDRLKSLKEHANDVDFVNVAALIDFKQIIENMETSKEFVDLKDELKPYDIVGFNMLKIGKNYQPELSECIVGMVKDIEDLDITLNLLAGRDELSCPEGKLSMDIDEDTEPSDFLTLKRKEMLNVKVFVNN